MNDAQILFTHSYFLRYDPKQWDTGQPYAPIATLHAAALIRELGFHVSFFDTMFAQTPDAILPVLQKKRPKILVVYDDGFNYLTKMCLTNMRDAAFRMIRLAKQQGCTVIVSSSDATDHYELYLNKGSDFIILGEGEQTLAELVTSIDNGSGVWLTIPGIAYKQQHAVIKTGKRAVLKDLDLLPLPAWDLVDITDYRKMWMKHRGFFSINIAT
ncbi:MAG TPA: radical SAM protein, partial [Chitinophagaceae bacterium]|nr:radical SAM protein [Chitinophagaceae bacterium]